LLFRPEVGVVTNVDLDHVDFYPGGLPEIEAAFRAFAERSGHVVVCADDPGAMRAIPPGSSRVTYGRSETADVRVEVSSPGPGGAAGTVITDGERVPLRIAVDGEHNLWNAAAAIAAARLVGVPV